MTGGQRVFGRLILAAVLLLVLVSAGAAETILLPAFPPAGSADQYQVSMESVITADKRSPVEVNTRSTFVQKVEALEGANMTRVTLDSRNAMVETSSGKETERSFPADSSVVLMGDDQRYYLMPGSQADAQVEQTIRSFLGNMPVRREVQLGSTWREAGEVVLPEIGSVPVAVEYRCQQTGSHQGYQCLVLAGRVIPEAGGEIDKRLESFEIAGEAAIYVDAKTGRVVESHGKVDLHGKLQSGNKFRAQMKTTVQLQDRTGQAEHTSSWLVGWWDSTTPLARGGLPALLGAGLFVLLLCWHPVRSRHSRWARGMALLLILTLAGGLVLSIRQEAKADTAVSRGAWLGGSLGYFLHSMGATLVLATSYTTFGLVSYVVSVPTSFVLGFGEPGYRFYLERAQRHFAMVLERGHYSAMTDEMVHSPSVLDIVGHEIDSTAEMATDVSLMGVITSANFLADRGEFLLFGALDIWEDLASGNISDPGYGNYRVGSASEYLEAERRTGRALSRPPDVVRGYPEP
jgi:hypothetical protein